MKPFALGKTRELWAAGLRTNPRYELESSSLLSLLSLPSSSSSVCRSVRSIIPRLYSADASFAK